MKVSDYVATHLKMYRKVFSVTGGFAMHLNESFSKTHEVIYQHGEGPCGYSAMGYSRMNLEPSIVCVTAGCGATNAVTPCLIAYQDSVPVFFISGAVAHKDNVRHLRHSVRTYTGSDCDIVSMVKHITKFAYELTDPRDVKNIIGQCITHMTSGVPGPVWLSIPIDIQAMEVPDDDSETDVLELWMKSKRPVVIVGNGIRLSGTTSQLEEFVKTHNVPVVCTFFGTDLVPSHNIGRVGIIGDRTGNFTVQNADLVLCLGCRLAKTVIGYRPEWFARDANVFKCSDLNEFFRQSLPFIDRTEWMATVRKWHEKWFRELPNPESDICPYTFLNKFYTLKPPGETTVLSSGSIVCVAWHQCLVKPGDRYIMSSHGDMGYELPVAIGCAIASGKTTWVIHGDGSFQYNFQEIETITRLKLPVKILVFNNGGYGAIKITQSAYFGNIVGTEFDNLPSIKGLAGVYGIEYFTKYQLEDAIAHKGPCIVEVTCHVQERYPKVQNKMNADGSFSNKPIEDMWPEIERGEFLKNMIVKPI